LASPVANAPLSPAASAIEPRCVACDRVKRKRLTDGPWLAFAASAVMGKGRGVGGCRRGAVQEGEGGGEEGAFTTQGDPARRPA
jgi:hypothetical protein